MALKNQQPKILESKSGQKAVFTLLGKNKKQLELEVPVATGLLDRMQQNREVRYEERVTKRFELHVLGGP